MKEKKASVYLRLLRYALPWKGIFFLAILGNIGFALIDAYMIALMKPLLDQGFIGKDPAIFAMTPYLIVFTVFGRGIMSFLSTYCMNYVGRQVVMVMRQELFTQFLHLPVSYFDKTSAGNIISRITYNTGQVASASTDAVQSVVKEGATIIFLISLMLYYSWQLTLILLVMAPIIFGIVFVVSQRFRRLSKSIQISMGGITHEAEESIEGIRDVKVFNQAERHTKRFNSISNRNRQQEMKMVATKAITSPLVQSLVSLVLAVVVWMASMEALTSAVTAGTFISMSVALIALMRPIKKMTDINTVVQKGIVAADSIFEILDLEREKDTDTAEKSNTVLRVKGDIAYNNVSFSYDGTHQQVLKHASLEIKAGQSIAFVGKSGSGKSTLVQLLPRFYEGYEGTITLDGREIQNYSLIELRSQFALVSQHVTLLNDTIFENIAYGLATGANKEEVYEAAKAAHVTEFVEKLPEGFNTIIGDNGLMLSGGQRQRLAIARAILKNAPILILDEATSALDSESEKHIQDALQQLAKRSTMLIIAHRLSTIEHADQIVVLHQGEIVERGNHQELLAKGGYYAALSARQST